MAQTKVTKIKVKALPEFKYRRLITIPGLSKKDFRALQAGDSVEIESKVFDKSIMTKVVKDGNKQNRVSTNR